MNRLALYVLVIVACVLTHLFALPEYKSLEEKEVALAEVELERDIAMLKKDRVLREARALQEDPEYMELKSRDVLDYYLPGEIIFDINRKNRSDR